MNNRPLVGIGIIVLKKHIIRLENKVLFGKRKNAHGDGTSSFPGGNLEYFESLERCVERELYEETGLILGEDVKLLKQNPVAVTNDFFKEENKHYITVYMLTEKISDKLEKVMEPDKCEKWDYYKWHVPPTPLFTPIKNLIKQGYEPF